MALKHLSHIRAFDRNRILDDIEEQLSDEPTCQTQRKKMIEGIEPPWEQPPPVWQLRTGEYRIFYDVDEEATQVTVHAILYKGSKTTGEIL